MWELIQANRKKSWILFGAMGACLLLLGHFVGAAFFPPDGWIAGLALAFGLWITMSLVSYLGGDSILLAVSRAKEVSHDLHPQLFNVVEEMKIAASCPAMPKVYIIDDPAPNAFATGMKPERSAIAVTAGLLSRLNRDELQGVIAHEMSHIMNRDVLFVTLAGMLLGGIVLISQVFLRGLWFSSRSSKRYRSAVRGGGQAQLIIMAVAIVLAILAPLLARLLYFAISRRREYLADASAVRLTRYPEGLASALEKISSSRFDLESANKVTAPMYIVNPLKEKGRALSDLTSTHPPISERVRILRSMVNGAGYSDYQKAFSQTKGRVSPLIPISELRGTKTVPIRTPTVEEGAGAAEKRKGAREVGDLIRAVNQYAFLVCACGLKIKVPPDFQKTSIPCPRCGRELMVPVAELAAVTAAVGTVAAAEEKKEEAAGRESRPLVYVRKGKGWETFQCSCGRLLQLSPAFRASHLVCSTCGRTTEIRDQSKDADGEVPGSTEGDGAREVSAVDSG
jgi:heat shock protein HtpX